MQKRVVILLLCFVAAAVAVARADRVEVTPLRASFATFPMQVGEWAGIQQPPMTKRELEVLDLSDYVVRAYYRPNQTSVGLYVGFWQSQRQGSTIHSPQNCMPGAGWEPVSQSVLKFSDPRRDGAPPIETNRLVFQKGLDRMVVLYWYQSHGRIVASEYWSKIYLVTDAVRLNRTDGAVVRLTIPIDSRRPDGEQLAEREGVAFAQALVPRLDGFLPN
ncbi:MAG TPA: EpsI family protein [Vicinamibacterales bacterium]|nr:EpsI family protein [Vicinamibacterales bacterium]